jgi:hypothetical protein
MVTSIYAQFVEESYASLADEVGGGLASADAPRAVREPVPAAAERPSVAAESDDVWLL